MRCQIIILQKVCSRTMCPRTETGVCCMALGVLRAVMHACCVPIAGCCPGHKTCQSLQYAVFIAEAVQIYNVPAAARKLRKLMGNTIGHTCKDQERIRKRGACPPSNCAAIMSLAGQTFRMAASRGAAARPLMRQALRHRVSRKSSLRPDRALRDCK